MKVYKLIRAEAREQMSSQDRPEATAAASAPAREPDTQPTETRGDRPSTNSSASGSSTSATREAGRRHGRRRHRTGGSSSGSGVGEQREPQGRQAQAERGQSQPERELNLDELRELSELLNEQGFNDFEIEREGFRLRLSRHAPAPPAHAPTQAFVPPTVTPHAQPPTTAQTSTT